MHVDISEFSGKDIQSSKIVVVLLKGGKVVGSDAHHMMDEIAHIQESVVLHEDNVPDKVARGVHKH